MNCRTLLEQLENNPPLDGYLSIKHGFMPPTLPLNKLSWPYSIWDEYVSLIPELFYSNQTQVVLADMPLLAVKALSDEELPRAALVLSLLAHAYWRHGNDRAFAVRTSEIDGELPDSIRLPWEAVNERLGRGKRPYQNFYDLFLNNFTLLNAPDAQGSYDHSDVKIENLNVLVPSFGNQAEQVFYMSFVEMHANGTPLIEAVVEIEKAIEKNDASTPAKIIQSLETIEEILQKCLKTLRKISPIENSKTYCDPILWSKTIAIFAVPPSNYPQGGTSGAFAPLALTLDALLNRRKYDSEYGQYVMKGRECLLPSHIIEFVKATGQIDLIGFIKSKQDSPDVYTPLAEAYNKVIDVYAGSSGFLGKHMAKAFNYLGVATMVGRNQSTSGHERYAHKQTWSHVSKALDVARLERYSTDIPPTQAEVPQAKVDMPVGLPIYTRLDLARHHKPDDYWAVIDGYVYDLTDYLKYHPGGDEIMLAYAGQDVSDMFHAIPEHAKPKMQKMMQRYVIGRFQEDTCTDQNYIACKALLEKLIFVRAILAMQFQPVADKRLGALFAGHTHTHFVQEHLATIFEAIPHQHIVENELVNTTIWHQLQTKQFILDRDLRDTSSQEYLTHFEAISDLFAKADFQLVDDLIDFVLRVLTGDRYEGKMVASTCADMVKRWAGHHLAVMEVAKQREEALFGQVEHNFDLSGKVHFSPSVFVNSSNNFKEIYNDPTTNQPGTRILRPGGAYRG